MFVLVRFERSITLQQGGCMAMAFSLRQGQWQKKIFLVHLCTQYKNGKTKQKSQAKGIIGMLKVNDVEKNI